MERYGISKHLSVNAQLKLIGMASCVVQDLNVHQERYGTQQLTNVSAQ